MLGKKSLAIALMGLGLAGSCYAAGEPTNSVSVNFQATVKAATCPFSVTVGEQTVGESSLTSNIKVGEYNVNQETGKETMTIAMACGETVTFNSVTITSSATNGVATVDGKNSQFEFYNDNDSPWKDPIVFNHNDNLSITKKVRFNMRTDSSLPVEKGTHEANVQFTATYQ